MNRSAQANAHLECAQRRNVQRRQSNWLGGVAPVSGDAASSTCPMRTPLTSPASVSNVGLTVRNDTVTFDLAGFSFSTVGSPLSGGGDGDVSRPDHHQRQRSRPPRRRSAPPPVWRQTLTVSSLARSLSLPFLRRVSRRSVARGEQRRRRQRPHRAVTVGGSGGTGTVSISGFNSTMTTSSTMTVANNGPGVLNVTGGGTINIGGNLTLGAGGSGSVTSAAPDSKLTTTGTLTIGNGSQGAMRVDAGAFVQWRNDDRGQHIIRCAGRF
jgi:T5SS/PEP-CTERM-associated repeat protein